MLIPIISLCSLCILRLYLVSGGTRKILITSCVKCTSPAWPGGEEGRVVGRMAGYWSVGVKVVHDSCLPCPPYLPSLYLPFLPLALPPFLSSLPTCLPSLPPYQPARPPLPPLLSYFFLFYFPESSFPPYFLFSIVCLLALHPSPPYLPVCLQPCLPTACPTSYLILPALYTPCFLSKSLLLLSCSPLSF